MMRIAIIGAGPAGIEAALAARKAGALSVTLFSREPVLPYARPKLPEAAFTDGDVSPFSIHPQSWYDEHGITLRLDTPVTSLNVDDRVIQTPDGDEVFEAFVLAGGANPLKPIIPGLLASPSLYTLWSADDAKKISKHCRRGRIAAIVGGGILGIEAAICAAKAKKQVILIEKAPRLMAGKLDKETSELVKSKLEALGVDVKVGTSLVSASQIASKLCLKLDGENKSIDVDMVILSVGAKANLSLAQSAGLAVDRGICVDETLQTSAANVYAAGDCAQFGIASHNCVAAAIEQGRIAGYNAVAALTGAEPKVCPIKDYPLHYIGKELEIHAWGQTAERCINAKTVKMPAGKKADGALRMKVVRSDGVVAGVQMIDSSEGFLDLISGK